VATLHLDARSSYFIAHSEEAYDTNDYNDFTAEISADVVASSGLVELVVYPLEAAVVWEGEFTALDPIGSSVTEVRHQVKPAGGIEAWDRLDSFSVSSTLRWTNDPAPYADLYLGYANGDDDMATDDFFNDYQGPGEGDVEEEDWSMWYDVLYAMCDPTEQGLTLIVYDPGDAVATQQTPVAFEWELSVFLESPLTPFLHHQDYCDW
jgi:hypothetical protein